MKNQLDALRDMTTVVADTGDVDAIKKYQPYDATTNPSLILKAASLPQYQHLIDKSLSWARAQTNKKARQIMYANDMLCVLIGKEISESVPGKVSTEVDARLSFDTLATIDKARQLIRLYEEEGVDNRMEHVKAKEKTMIYEMENFERRNEDYAHAEKKLNDIARKEEQVARNLEKKKEILL